MDESIPLASRDYFIFVAVLLFSRGMDFLSTWIATPHLVLEGNPIAKWLGWKWGALVNVALVGSLALWPLSAIIVSTASVLVAARNFQSAWLMRSMGEETYREWYVQRMSETPVTLYLSCLAGNTLLPAAIGGALILFSTTRDYVLLVPLGIGVGAIAYSVAVIVFTLLALWRNRRRRTTTFDAEGME
ncbi:MAG: hypothetical protein KIS67_09260 [Verrucomicrobiae bacterium]|nr:hypothetical protein [Verrucomicrobiae bacterium]